VSIPRPALLLALLAAWVPPAAAATPVVVEKVLRYEPGRFSVVERGGETLVEMRGASREFTPGRPDLPLLGEPIELPDDVRVSRVEVVSLATAVLSAKARVPAAAKIVPGLAPLVRTQPDPAFFDRTGFPDPASLAFLGYEGWMRGRHMAWLQVRPARWDPASGRLERVASMTVRLTLEPYRNPDVVRRERIVSEWEASHAAEDPSAPAALGTRRLAQPFKPTQVPSVIGSPVAYVIITTDALAAEFQRLADWKTQSGVPAVVRTLTFIRQQYPFGADDADRMRQFIRDAYSRWGAKWVLLGGDTDLIPFRMIYSTFFGGDYIPAEMYFSCLDGNWNADGDSTYGEGYATANQPGDDADLLPEVYVGRAPVTTVAEAQLFVNKNFQYTRTPVGDYEHLIEFFAEVLFPQAWTPGQLTQLDGAELVEEVMPSVQFNPGIHALRLYENYLDPRWPPGSLQETKAKVLDSLKAGYNMAVHIGHGYRNVMSVGDGSIQNSDVSALTNGNRLSNVYAINCTSNAIDFPCIGEAFLNAPSGGSVTNVGSARSDFPYAGRAIQQEYFKLMFKDSVTAVGEAQAKQKLPSVPNSTDDSVDRWVQMGMLLLGDPELHQWTAKPRTLTVVKPSTYTVRDTSLSVTVSISGAPLYGAKVTAYKPNEDYRSATTNGSGIAVLDFRPDSVGPLYLTVTGFNCRPRQDTITVTTPSAVALVDRTPAIDDDAVGGTSGNANGKLDAGETIDLQVPVTNRGGTSASSVTGTLSTTDGLVTMITPGVSYGTIGVNATANGSGKFRFSLPYTFPDQREIPFKLDLFASGGLHYIRRFSLTALAPEPRHLTHSIVDASGNGNGVPEAGETITFFVKLRNLGTGTATGATARLRNYDGLATVTDSSAAFGNIATGQEVQGDAMTYTVGNATAKLELRISNSQGLLSTQTIDLVRPAQPTALVASGAQSSISLKWTHSAVPDLAGYNVYRSTAVGGPFSKVNTVPTDRTSYYRDEGLSPLTRYYYKVSAVDSSGNESPQSLVAETSTNPPYHAIFPVEMRRNTPASVAIEHVYQTNMMDICAGSDVLWMWHADGTIPIDADGTSVSYGDFTTRGSYYAAGPSLAKLDLANWSVIAPSWDSLAVYVFDPQGNVRPGWPFPTADPVWSGVAVGDLNNDGSRELVFGSNGSRFYALRANGTEWMDGDSNPATLGVFKVLGSLYNYGTPALADLDKNGQLDIVYAGFEGKLFAWRPDGSNLPGFPATIGAGTTSSVAVGYLDGTGDSQLDIVVASANESLYVFKADGGRRAGFPIGIPFDQGTDKDPSPALADIDANGYADIVAPSANGNLYVIDRNGVNLPAFVGVRYSALIANATSCSPVVADLNGDGVPDILTGDENGVLNGFSGTGQPLAGFPIQLGAEVRGSPAVCDCDGDGKTEIVVSSWDKKTYMWDYDFPFSPGGQPPWPQFHHDAMRTGLATNAPFLGSPYPSPPLVPESVELAPPQPNPARRTARISWAVPADRVGADFDLSIFDLTGRRVARLASGTARAGRFATEWNLRSAAGERMGGGMYFLRFRVGPDVTSRKLVVVP
jgi:peptidase C25-like protein/VCBS repeat protein/fibronectin type III domain protein